MTSVAGSMSKPKTTKRPMALRGLRSISSETVSQLVFSVADIFSSFIVHASFLVKRAATRLAMH